MKTSKYQVGQMVWVYGSGRMPIQLPVTKVGHKYVTVGRSQYRVEDGVMPEYGSHYIRTEEERVAAEARAADSEFLREHNVDVYRAKPEVRAVVLAALRRHFGGG